MKNFQLTLLVLLLGFGSMASLKAQAVRNTAERASDRNQIQRDKQVIARDQAELQQFVEDKQAFTMAISNGNVARAKKAHAQIVASMEREIAQGEAKIRQSRKEVAGSQSELRSSRREVRNTRGTGRPVATVDDRMDKRDDKRDLRDDRRDREEQEVRNARQKAILADLRSVRVNGPGDLPALRAKRQIIDEFETTMRRDMGENVEELREDKGELREDRRETREDRRQR